MKYYSKFTIVLVIVFFWFPAALVFAQSASSSRTDSATADRAELEARIQTQNLELEKLNAQLIATQNKLESAKTERVSLQKELTNIKNSISQLNLNIKSDKINIQKLTLEIDSLNYDIRDIEISMDEKKKSIAELLREISRNDQVNLLTVLLNGNSLAESVSDVQALSDTSLQLGADIGNLETLKGDKIVKVDSVSAKKVEISLRSKNLENRKSIIQDQEGEKATLLAQTQNKESQYQKDLEDLRKKQNEVEDEISKFESELRAKFDVSVLPTKRSGVFEWPVKLRKDGGTGIITQHMGEISNLYRGKPHNGLDIGTPLGTPVFAAEEGKVIAVDNNDRSSWKKYQYGKYILIEHPNNMATLYAHLSKQIVQKGAAVKRGDLIGYSGNTGYSTGPHLHFGLYWSPSIIMKSVPPATGLVPVGVVVNPEDYL
ncbi:MAG: peptidoglycan DD-metalloendopeptidase family protein [Patescibacteria group bacterium]